MKTVVRIVVFFAAVRLVVAQGAAAGVAFAQTSIPVVVVDGSGQTVRGMQKPDFSVNCGQAATLDAAEEVTPAALSGFSDPTPVFVLYDAPSIESPLQPKLSTLLLGFLRTAVNEHLAVTLLENTGTSLELIHDLSVDPAVLAAALDRVSPKKDQAQVSSPLAPSSAEWQKKVDDATTRLQTLTRAILPKVAREKVAGEAGPQPGANPIHERLASLRLVSKMLQRSRQRKLLVWITGYLPISVDKGRLVLQQSSGAFMIWDPQLNMSRPCRDESACGEAHYASPSVDITSGEWATTIQALNDSRISLYPIHVGRVTHCCVGPPDYRLSNGLETLARATGGFGVLSKEVDLASAISELRRGFGPYYLLTITPGSASEGSWTACSVKVNKSGLRAVAPEGFFAQH